MFDVRRVAQNIRDARISKNMTQSNLADELGVSYQAVSNWERGNSLPDISKYEDLCRILDLKLEDLLGGGSNTDAVSKLIDHRKGENSDPLTVEEMESVADLLAPEDLKETVKEHLDQISFGLKDVKRLAPFLDKETLDELVENCAPDDSKVIAELAPFLRKKTIRRLLERLEDIDVKDLRRLAPFLDKEMLDSLVEDLVPDNPQVIVELAPFLRKSSIRRLLERLDDNDLQFKTLVKLAPFLDKETLEEILESMDVKDIDRIEKIAPFLSRETLKKWIENALKSFPTQ